MVMTDNDNASEMQLAIEYEVSGFVPSSLCADLAVAAIQLVLAGGIFAPERLITDYCRSRNDPGHQMLPKPAAIGACHVAVNALTTREMEVSTRLQQGKPNKIIAYELHISESTVKVHMRNIMKKLNATNRTQVVAYLNKARLVNDTASVTLAGERGSSATSYVSPDFLQTTDTLPLPVSELAL